MITPITVGDAALAAGERGAAETERRCVELVHDAMPGLPERTRAR